MRVHVGSKNKTKVEATKRAFAGSEKFKHAEIVGVAVEVPEFGHPRTLKETIEGAKARAAAAFAGADFGVGIEGGLMEVPHSKTGFMETAACMIYDGKQFCLGLAPACEWPLKVTELILGGLDGSQAFKAAGLTTHEKIGAEQGSIHYLTKGQLTRTDQNLPAVIMALIHLEHPELYQE